MNPEQDDKWIETLIQRAVGSEEAQFDAANWRRRLQALLRAEAPEVPDDQNDLFGD